MGTNLEINLNAKKRISFLTDNIYKLFNNNSKRFENSSDLINGHFFFDKLNNLDKNKDSDLFKAKGKRNWNNLNLFGINNKIKINDDSSEFKIMPVNKVIPDVPRSVSDAVMHGMSINTSKRPQNISDLINELESVRKKITIK